ncbi:hypothetical protein [Actinocorallia aurantiaca]|uniref:SUKH-4 immunity protein of toxin-antitoxin system n=1 Tax=Actinocorallia aurantiaca TaxID=46204 RepID=A0ABN3U378_9ACTN
MSAHGLGVVEFQLYLLHTMDPPARLLTEALDRLGLTDADMRNAAERISPVLRPRLGPAGAGTNMAADLQAILGKALVPRLDDIDDRRFYRLPLWEGFVFGVSFAGAGRLIESAEFVREPGTAEEPPEPAVWEFLEADLLGPFCEARMVDTWGHYRTYLTRRPEDPNEYFLRFAWGMLQEVETADTGERSANT